MIDESILDELKEKHGELLVAEAPGGEDAVAMRMPTRKEYEHVRSLLFNEKRRQHAPEQLFHYVVVHPDKASIEQLLQRRPGLADAFGGKALEFAGLVEVEVKKY